MATSLNNFPCAPAGKSGWPWNVASEKENSSTKEDYAQISIVTPSYNQGAFIEETIRSVLLQGYPNLEYIIIDGGSSDGSVDIIKKYSKWLKYWVSEPDQGQSQALNKGFSKASGKILGYINSDDIYEPNALNRIAEVFRNKNDCSLMAASCLVFESESVKMIFTPWWPDDMSHFLRNTFSSTFAQPASFWTKAVYERIGGFDESLHFCFDREFFLRIGLEGFRPELITETIARFREHPDSKSVGRVADFHRDSAKILNKYAHVCGIREDERKSIEKRMLAEIRYHDVFNRWKENGRVEAIKSYFSWIIRSPKVLMQRKILGQGRRLLFYAAHNVNELQ